MQRTENESNHLQAEIVLSMPEVNALCVRAARGSGYSWGLSEECGKAAAWLGAHQLDWAASLIRLLANNCNALIKPATHNWQTQGIACPIRAGATLTDFATLAEGLQNDSLVIGDIYHHIWFTPFVARASQLCNKPVDIYADGTLWARINASSVSITDVALSLKPVAHILLETNVTPAAESSADSPALLAQTTTIPRSAFAQLENIALRMSVPSTQESQARAGGTGSDND